jgi:hypothetical protein
MSTNNSSNVVVAYNKSDFAYTKFGEPEDIAKCQNIAVSKMDVNDTQTCSTVSMCQDPMSIRCIKCKYNNQLCINKSLATNIDNMLMINSGADKRYQDTLNEYNNNVSDLACISLGILIIFSVIYIQ